MKPFDTAPPTGAAAKKETLQEYRKRVRRENSDAAKQWTEHLRDGQGILSTTNEVLDAYLAAKGTADTKCVIENWVRPAFGELAPDALTAREIEAWVEGMRFAALTRGRPLPPKTERTRYAALAAAFSWARRIGLLEHNHAILPQGILQRNGVRETFDVAAEIPTLDEFRRILTSSRIPLDRRLDYAIAGAAGLRSGERYDLRIGDVDFTRTPNPSLWIDSSWCRKENRVKPTKTKTARTVPAHLGCVAPLLREWIEHGWFRAFNRMPQPEDLLLPRSGRSRATQGGLLHRNDRQALKRWHKDLKANGLAKRRLHALRHFFCTSLVHGGADWRAVERLSHPSPRWRKGAEAYVHSSYEWLCETVQKLQLDLTATPLGIVSARGSSLRSWTEAVEFYLRKERKSAGVSSDSVNPPTHPSWATTRRTM